MPNEPRWLPIEAVIEHNRLEVEETGERHFLRDQGLLESALARPQNAFAYGEEDVVVLAVRLLAGIAFAHAFEQGNKRTAFEAMWHSLRLNGYDLAIEDSALWEVPVIDLIERRSTEREFALALRPFVVER
ncbi:MAG TPA: type II toxin-antitoxin system death-on-curing family toxin [Stellaceae bacterium]|nr:type II toxin-antitoxin system death-on-curing family toxin [Stellaceae bacterium]